MAVKQNERMYFIHEHNSGIGSIRGNLSLLKLYIKNDELTKENVKECIERIEESVQKTQDAVDYIYNKIKQ